MLCKVIADPWLTWKPWSGVFCCGGCRRCDGEFDQLLHNSACDLLNLDHSCNTVCAYGRVCINVNAHVMKLNRLGGTSCSSPDNPSNLKACLERLQFTWIWAWGLRCVITECCWRCCNIWLCGSIGLDVTASTALSLQQLEYHTWDSETLRPWSHEQRLLPDQPLNISLVHQSVNSSSRRGITTSSTWQDGFTLARLLWTNR